MGLFSKIGSVAKKAGQGAASVAGGVTNTVSNLFGGDGSQQNGATRKAISKAEAKILGIVGLSEGVAGEMTNTGLHDVIGGAANLLQKGGSLVSSIAGGIKNKFGWKGLAVAGGATALAGKVAYDKLTQNNTTDKSIATDHASQKQIAKTDSHHLAPEKKDRRSQVVSDQYEPSKNVINLANKRNEKALENGNIHTDNVHAIEKYRNRNSRILLVSDLAEATERNQKTHPLEKYRNRGRIGLVTDIAEATDRNQGKGNLKPLDNRNFIVDPAETSAHDSREHNVTEKRGNNVFNLDARRAEKGFPQNPGISVPNTTPNLVEKKAVGF